MKKTVFLTIIAFFIQMPLSHAYIVDGSLSDWGVDLSTSAAKNLHYLDSNTPTGKTVNYVTEDNAAYNTGTHFVGPGYALGNDYDAEALYFDNDMTYAYIAVVTGVPKTEATYPSGDIFIDTGKYQDPSSPNYNTKKYKYGIDISTSKLYSVGSWINPAIFTASSPWKIGNTKTFLGDVDFVYSAAQNSHYVLETRVPLNLLGINLQPGDTPENIWLHWTMKCGNDDLRLKADLNTVPEPSSIFLLGSGLLLALRRRLGFNAA